MHIYYLKNLGKVPKTSQGGNDHQEWGVLRTWIKFGGGEENIATICWGQTFQKGLEMCGGKFVPYPPLKIAFSLEKATSKSKFTTFNF